MNKNRGGSGILYLTPFDPLIYRRPKFARLALPELRLVYYEQAWRLSMGSLGRILNKVHYGLRKIERRFFTSGRWGGDHLLGAYYYDFLNYLLIIRKLQPRALITLNTPLALGVKVLEKDVSVIVDWMDIQMRPGNMMSPLDIRTVEMADAVIFWSHPFMKLVKKRLTIPRATYIPLGVDLGQFDPPRQDDGQDFKRRLGLRNKFLILYSGGYLESREGVDMQGLTKVLEAFAIFSKSTKDSVLVLQIFNLDQESKRSLVKTLKRLGIRDRSVIIGKFPSFNDPDRQRLFSAADMLVMPASRHPLIYYAERMKAFQYMASTNPILAEKTPGAVSTLKETALYVSLDDVEEMADGMLKLYRNQELRIKLGELARKRVESQFDWRVLIPKYREFLLKTID